MELKLSLHEIGQCGATIYKGAREGGMSRTDALYVVAGWFLALLVQGTNDD
jgi:hypothetical protein